MCAEISLGLDFFPFTSPGVTIGAGNDLVGHHALVLLDDRVIVAASDQALDRKERLLGIGNGLTLRGGSHQYLAIGAEGHHGWGGPGTFGILDDLGLFALHHRDAGIGGAEIDADCFRHASLRIRKSNNDDEGSRARES